MSPICGVRTAVFVFAALSAVRGLAAEQAEFKSVGDEPDRQTGSDHLNNRVDDFGDPLPPGAIARLGTLRMRSRAAICSLAVSPDGRVVASGAYDRSGSVQLWESGTGKELLSIDNGDQFVAISLDAKTLATYGKYDGSVRLWELASGEPIRTVKVLDGENAAQKAGPPDHGIGCVAFSPDGKWLVAETWREDQRGKPQYPRYRTIRIVDLATGEQLRSFVVPDDVGHGQAYFALSPDGGSLAVISGKDQTVYVVDLTTTGIRASLGSSALYCCFSGDGTKLAIADYRRVRLFDMQTHREIGTFSEFRGRDGYRPGPVALSRDGRLLAVGGDYHEPLRVVDTSTGRLVLKASSKGAERTAALEFSPDGKVLIAAVGKIIRMWDVASGTETVLGDVRRRELTCAVFSPDGKTLALCGGDRGARLYDVATRKPLRQFAEGENVRSVAFSPDGRTAATAGQTLCLWRTATGGKLRTLQENLNRVKGDAWSLSSVAFLPDGNRLVSGNFSGMMQLWDASTGEEVRSYQQPLNADHRPDSIYGVAVFPDGKRVATLTGNVHIWNLNTAELLSTFDGPDWNSRPGRPLAISPDGRVLAFERSLRAKKPASTQGVVLQEVEGNNQARRLDDGEGLPTSLWGVSVAFTPNGQFLATGSADKSVRLWDVATGRELHRFDGHLDWVSHVDFSPDGNTLASASWDGTVLLWDVSGVKNNP